MQILKSHSFILAFLLVAATATRTYSQVENYEFSSAKPGILDTVAMQTSQRIVEESTGILEKEIDPDQYIMGPGDKLKIVVIGSKTREYLIFVSPDGRVLIPDAGLVDLKGKTFREAERDIIKKLGSTFRTKDIFVVLSDVRKFKVSISGAVKKPSIVPTTAVDRVSEVVEKAGGFKPDGSIRKIQLFRSGTTEPFQIDLMKYFKLGYDHSNPYVLGGDRIIIPNMNQEHTIAIRGEIPFPGEYEFVMGDSLSTLIKFGNGFYESSFLDSVEFVRFNNGIVEKRYLDLNSWRDLIYSNEALTDDFPLQSGDRVYIRKDPRLTEIYEVIIQGEILYPGKYAVDGVTTRVSDIVNLAGGVTHKASLEASLLYRQDEMDSKDMEMERLRTIPPGEMSESEYKYYQARLNERVGVMAISFPKLMNNPNAEDNIILLNRDSIIISEKKYFINVQGRVNNPGLVVYKPNYTYLDYINAAGGFGFRSDEGATMVVKSKGQQFDAESRNYVITPGDYILVPPKEEISWGNIAMTTLTVVAQLVAVVGVVIAVSRTN